MSKAAYYQRGEALDYNNTTTDKIEALTIVTLTSRIGIVGTDINPGETGSVEVDGVFEIAKTGAGAIGQGTLVYFDGDGITATAGSNIPAGYAAEPALAADTTVKVKLLG